MLVLARRGEKAGTFTALGWRLTLKADAGRSVMNNVIAFNRLKKRSDLPDWFPLLDVYQRELSKKEWLTELVMRCAVAQAAPQRDDPLALFRGLIIDQERDLLGDPQDKLPFPVNGITAFEAIFIATGLRGEKFKPAWKWAEKLYKKETALGEFIEKGAKEWISEIGACFDGDLYEHLPDVLSGYPITVNLYHDDETLVRAFKLWLKIIRTRMELEASKPFGEADFRKWREYQILAVFDLDLWGQLTGCRYTDSLIARSLWPNTRSDADPDKIIDAEKLRKTIRRKVAEIVNWQTVNRFWLQVELEEAWKKKLEENSV